MSKFVQADLKIINTPTSLTKAQKESVGLLSIGTFLEYFEALSKKLCKFRNRLYIKV
ncbi:hypothetical protein [Candidatus Tisiphia endosymbiont of Nedyus quadrimaculatus]|uniref:hypothetical protein n=1 Tax=Candidatus Tisiphia endosymbiont of Nedyus quadrimaculatus TaxID=3139332 RepID=UPI00345EB580